MNTYDPLNYKLSEFNKFKPEKGRLLISDPFLPDPYFKRSVVLLVDHNEKGSLGFILNKALDITLADTELKIKNTEYEMYFGGPVQSTDLFYIHSLGNIIEGSTEVKDGLYWGGDFKMIEEKIRDGSIRKTDIRFFVGYSGWEEKQLEKEIKQNSWLVHETDLTTLFHSDSENMWKNILKELDSRISILATFPEDPNMN